MSRTLRSRMGLGAGALVALCLSAAAAVAQDRPVTTKPDRADSVKVHLGGKVDMDYVQRDKTLRSLAGMQDITNFLSPTPTLGNDSTNDIEGDISIRADVELTEKISGGIEIRRSRIVEPVGVIPMFGMDISDTIVLRDAHMKLSDFLSPGLTARLGIQNWDFDVRGRGSAFAFAPYYAQPITSLASLGTRNILDAQDTVAPGGNLASYGTLSAAEGTPVGIHLNYKSGSISIDLVALPMITEGGEPNGDESLYAVDFWYDLTESMGKGSRIGAILAVSHVDPALTGGTNDSKFITGGVGANLAFSGGFEVYGEVYFQTGSINENLDADGLAFQIGGRWTGEDGKFWVELNFTMLSGDDSTDGDNSYFVSYENINDFVIIEDMYFGLDVDSNYTAIKIMGGLLLDLGAGKKNLELQLNIGFFSTTEDVVSTGGAQEDGLGTEVDVKAKYHLNKQAALVLNLGVLTSSDILEGMTTFTVGAASADDATWLASLGFDLTF